MVSCPVSQLYSNMYNPDITSPLPDSRASQNNLTSSEETTDNLEVEKYFWSDQSEFYEGEITEEEDENEEEEMEEEIAEEEEENEDVEMEEEITEEEEENKEEEMEEEIAEEKEENKEKKLEEEVFFLELQVEKAMEAMEI